MAAITQRAMARLPADRYASAAAFAEDLRVLGVTDVEYFGDLDRAGIQILRAVDEAAAACGSPPIRPAVRWYELLIHRKGMVAPLRDDTTMEPVSPELFAWFAEALTESAREPLHQVLQAGIRVPQELVGWECLAAML